MGCGSSNINVVVPVKKLTLPSTDGSKVNITEPFSASFVKDEYKLVFIFGGPGSCKGKIVTNLMSTFNVQLISVEGLILQSLPKKVQQVMNIQTTKEMAQLISTDPSHVTLGWALNLLKTALTGADKEPVYIIDMIPSLKWLLKNECLLKEDCSTEMKEFEEKFPISFSVHLSVNEACLQSTLAHSTATNKLLIAGTSVNDEADNSRAKKRYKAHETGMNPFVSYFTDNDKLITIDMSSGTVDEVWSSIKHYFITKGLQACGNVNITVIFTNGLTVGNLDFTDCDMKIFHLKDIIQQDTMTTETIIDCICGHIKDNSYFVIDTTDTTLLQEHTTALKSRILTFSDTLTDSNDQFTVQVNSIVGSCHFKSIGTTTGGHTLLFPLSTDDTLAQYITFLINKKLQKS